MENVFIWHFFPQKCALLEEAPEPAFSWPKNAGNLRFCVRNPKIRPFKVYKPINQNQPCMAAHYRRTRK